MWQCDSATGLTIYAFVLMFNSNIGPNMAPLRPIRLQNLGDFEFDISMSLKVKFNGAVELFIYDFLLVSNSNYLSNSHRLGVIAIRKCFSYLLLGPKFDTYTRPHYHPYPATIFFQNRITLSLGPREASHWKWSWSVKRFLRYVVNRHKDTRTDAHSDCNNPWRV